MNLDFELRELMGRVDGTPWPGEHGAYDRFLRRRTRRGRIVAAGAALALVGVLAGAVLVPRLRPPRWSRSPRPRPRCGSRARGSS